MSKLNLPHKDPILFAKEIISKKVDKCVVKIAFESIPTLAMLVEASAQSSAAFDNGDGKMGYLVTLKNIKLLHKPNALEYNVEITSGHSVDSLTYFSFDVFDDNIAIANGVFIISLQ